MRKPVRGLFIREHLPEEDKYPPPQMTDFDMVLIELSSKKFQAASRVMRES